jgi:hypothetical protein
VYKSGPIYKMLKYQEEWTLSCMVHLYLLMVVWVVLQVLWPANPSASWWSSCGQWRFFVLRLLLLVSSSWLVLSMLEVQVSEVIEILLLSGLGSHVGYCYAWVVVLCVWLTAGSVSRLFVYYSLVRHWGMYGNFSQKYEQNIVGRI